MESSIMAGEFKDLINNFPLINKMAESEEVFWQNPKLSQLKENSLLVSPDIIRDAAERLDRFKPFFRKAFPDTIENDGLIESPLLEIKALKHFYKEHASASGNFYVKLDSHLPVSGSIKARGGIYEILKHAETLALSHGLLNINDNYDLFLSEKFKNFFKNYAIAVGSTGNLGLSIGIISALLGFNVTVHMSKDAMEWKKAMLREKGVKVIEYNDDYSKAVIEGRKSAGENCHFVDDENSVDLFAGYSVSALRLEKQLQAMNIEVSENKPLFVYLPCGVGGGPGGVAYGLNHIFGKNVHCFFAEPTQSPCMLLGLMTGRHDKISVKDIGLSNKTCADGLAVGRPSSFAGKIVQPFINGSYTVSDNHLFRLMAEIADRENIFIEPSAAAGFYAPFMLFATPEGRKYLDTFFTSAQLNNAAHIMWATGGSMVPDYIMKKYYENGKKQAEI